jgi:uncharacterized membrane protein YidH (DUF202 family)
MKLPPGLSRVLQTDWFDWRRRDKRDAIVILGIAVLALVVGTVQDIALTLFQFAIDHADEKADDIIFVVFVLGVAMTVYGFRRYEDVSREIEARTIPECLAQPYCTQRYCHCD